MFQHEFALRIVAKPGDPLYCRLSANSQLLAKCSHVMKIARTNFRPPPKVDSSVIKLEPYSPPPPVNFVEWDGLVRTCFSRKNKTLAAIFKSKDVLDGLEKNFRTFAALHSMPVPHDWDARNVVIGLLEQNGYAEKRSAKMDQDDFLALLEMFNRHHIHFT
jgi:18S rRNA (adenine1779-N6/adenine1780-N6)-dimethyltransferase